MEPASLIIALCAWVTVRTPAQFNVPFFHRYCVKTYVGHREWVRTVKVSPDGRLLADEYKAEYGV